ncbi:integrase catalytic domain-containing protein [Trichonephila clavipes]|nr:integrase catalytic domain-containing protein [Trichonephila clavipes]
MLEKVSENWTSRLDYIRASRGSPMPEIIFKIKKYFKEDVEFVKELIQYTIEDRKRVEEDRKKEAENRLREKELELARLNVRVNSDNKRTGEDCNTLDALVKSVRILTVKVPNRPEERVQMLLGAEVFYELMLPGQFKMEGSNVIFPKTVFGFVVSGSTSSDAKGKEHCGFIQAADNLEHSIKEYEDLGHTREIKADGSGVSFYMPHHSVYNPEKSTIKLRTVFNASSPSTSGKYLNSILVQEDLFSIMVRFLKAQGIFTELTTVTYGTVSAPYLATRTLKQLAMDEANNFPLAAPVVMSDCYMDDILSGFESIEEVIELQHQLIEMFKTLRMHLHKWCGNLPEITSNLQEYAFLKSGETKALGIIWNPK